jgi:hypothetical protein
MNRTKFHISSSNLMEHFLFSDKIANILVIFQKCRTIHKHVANTILLSRYWQQNSMEIISSVSSKA